MLDKAITEFLDNKKADFLKKKIKPNIGEDEKIKIQQQANDKFHIKSWLIDASNRAGQLSITTHPAKFVHPNAKTTSIIADCQQKNDGLLRFGNVSVDLDVFGNAAALDVEKFLRIKFSDDKTVLQHLEINTDFIQAQFDIKDVNFNEIRSNFLKIKTSDLDQTSDKLKQVYFPVESNYHLLSILTPSGIVYKLKQRINAIRFSDENKTMREALSKKNPITGKIEDIKNLTALGYGGTKPQNISTLNNQNGGVSLLLSSMPPQLQKRKTQPPKTDFFDNCLWDNLFKDDFKYFHKVLSERKNNRPIRDKRDDIVLNSIIKVKRLVDNIRGIGASWSESDIYSELDEWQKIWLDDKSQDIRDDDKQNKKYLQQAQSGFANWFINHYQTSTNNNKTLGADDINHIKSILDNEKELLR